VGQFHHTTTGRFLPLPLEKGKRDSCHVPIIPKASPVALENQEIFEIWQMKIISRLVTTLVVFLRKGGLVSLHLVWTT
jgi:hypothetical protein